jgi:hopene-associated glycosyltransferase HpnB
MIWLAALSLVIWLGLTATGFWLFGERDERVMSAEPEVWPDVVAVVPARNEADVIARSLGSLAAQDYPGSFHVVLVDDNSEDATGQIAQELASERITVQSGAPLASGWTGKLWAVHQGVAVGGSPRYLWLTDADIDHASDTLRRLVTIAEGKQRVLVSFMAQLHCALWHEKALIPAFVHYFAMLYPFNWINRPGPIAGAAGGCVLVEREALERAGGIAAIRGALIDDCALGALMKRQGPIWLGLTHRSRSIRPYRSAGEVGAMIARSAYAQLRYSPLLLVATVIGLLLMFAAPLWLAIAGEGAVRLLGLASLGLMMVIFQPILRFYRLSPLWSLAQPLIGLFYTGCVVASAWQHWQGKGGMWKGRAQANRSAGMAA